MLQVASSWAASSGTQGGVSSRRSESSGHIQKHYPIPMVSIKKETWQAWPAAKCSHLVGEEERPGDRILTVNGFFAFLL